MRKVDRGNTFIYSGNRSPAPKRHNDNAGNKIIEALYVFLCKTKKA